MTKHYLFLIVLVLSIFSCNKSDKKLPAPNIFKALNTIKAKENRSIEELWNALLFEKSSCLIGSGYYKEIGIPDEYRNATFKDQNWKLFQSKNNKIITQFLLPKLSDTVRTKVHNCPNLNATQGEMAVYALQLVHHRNWWDFKEFSQFKVREPNDVTDHPQIWLQEVLGDTLKRKQLTELYLKELN